jgi:hypothetical protein
MEFDGITMTATLFDRVPPGEPNTPSVDESRESSSPDAAEPVTRLLTWPSPMHPHAFRGVLGEVTRMVEPETEADPAAILVQMLVMLSSVIGRRAHWLIEGVPQYLNLFACVVGRSSHGRKGVSLSHARRLFAQADSDWIEHCCVSGLSSGEGLIAAVRDRQDAVAGTVTEQRLLVTQQEFGAVLRCARRDGNTLTHTLRDAWDGGQLSTMTRADPLRATNAHIAVIGHITADELHRELTVTDKNNGFANRFLWICAKRTQTLPEGGRHLVLDPYVSRLRASVELGKRSMCLQFDDAARARWHDEYPNLTEDRPHTYDALTSRAAPMVRRLACLYALCDLSQVVRRPHLESAQAVWAYAEASARYLFGAGPRHPLADRVLAILHANSEPVARSVISGKLGRNVPARDLDDALRVLADAKVAKQVPSQTGGSGRPPELWMAVAPNERNERNERRGSQPLTTAEQGGASFVSFVPSPDTGTGDDESGVTFVE